MSFGTLDNMNSTLIKCERCPRLVEFREKVATRRNRFSDEIFWSKPVLGFGEIGSRLLILGLAPAATGGNRTGRVFTGDKSASFLFSCLYEIELSNKADSVSKDDGLVLKELYLTAVLKCVPPGDKPSREELKNCEDYLSFEIESMKNLKAVLVLGKVAFDSYRKYLKAKGVVVSDIVFGHGLSYSIDGVRLFCSYHPSPRNVNTRRLTKDGMISLLNEIKKFISSS